MHETKRQLQKQQTRGKIIETAYRVYSEQGFKATTGDIARAAGISHGSLFAHFPTLQALLVCLLEDFGQKIGTRLHSLSEKSGSLEALLTVHLAVLSQYEPFYTRLISEMASLPTEAGSIFISIQSIAAHHFAAVIEGEIAAGRVKSLPVAMLFNMWVGLVHYYLQNKAYFAPASPVIERWGPVLQSSYLELISFV